MDFYLSGNIGLLLCLFAWAFVVESGFYHDHYLPGFMVLMILALAFPRFIKRIKFWRTQEPALTVNDFFVEDHFRNRKYFWKDIKEIVSDARFLRVELYDPQPYIDRYRKPNALQRKWPKIFRRSKIFAIDIINLKIENEETLLDTLDDYSEKALELEGN